MNRPQSISKLPLDEKRRVLARIVRDPHASSATKLRAIELDSMLAGHFAPKQVVVEIGPNTLDAIRELPQELILALKQIALLGTGEAPAGNPAPLL
jgi:hypothetical protein